MLKLSTVLRVFKVVRVLGVLTLILYFTGFGPSEILSKIKPQLGIKKSELQVSSEVQKNKAVQSVESEEDLCLPMGERDRKQLFGATGVDVIHFLEQAAADLHGAKIAEKTEEQLKVMALSFDHKNWSKAWGGAELQESSALNANLSYTSMVLARYNRLLENGRRQEASALKAFHWQEEVRQEIRREPVRILVQSYLPYSCNRSDASYYGCTVGESIYRVKALMSPRIACRFKEKRDQYAVVYWIRVKDRAPKILEVDAKGHRLVKVTYDELEHRKLLSMLSPNVSDVLMAAGLDPFRAIAIWRQLNPSIESSRSPAATLGAGAPDSPNSAQPSQPNPADSYQSDAY